MLREAFRAGKASLTARERLLAAALPTHAANRVCARWEGLMLSFPLSLLVSTGDTEGLTNFLTHAGWQIGVQCNT